MSPECSCQAGERAGAQQLPSHPGSAPEPEPIRLYLGFWHSQSKGCGQVLVPAASRPQRFGFFNPEVQLFLVSPAASWTMVPQTAPNFVPCCNPPPPPPSPSSPQVLPVHWSCGRNCLAVTGLMLNTQQQPSSKASHGNPALLFVAISNPADNSSVPSASVTLHLPPAWSSVQH